MNTSKANIWLCRFNSQISCNADSTKPVQLLDQAVYAGRCRQIKFSTTFYNMHRCRTAHDHTKTINEHSFEVSLELVFFTLWLWSGYSREHNNHDIAYFPAKFTRNQGCGLDVSTNVSRSLQQLLSL